MNQKLLDEFWEQARIGRSFGHDMTKFAELIIRECCLLVDDHYEEKILKYFDLDQPQ